MKSEDTPNPPELKNRKLALVALIFGVVVMLLSGTCTLFFAGVDIANGGNDEYVNIWTILIVGGVFFIPSTLLFLLGRYVRKRGAGVWFTILMTVFLALIALFFLNIIGGIFGDIRF